MKKIAIDLGGTNIRCAVLNEQYEIECLEKKEQFIQEVWKITLSR